ncbi:probable flavin-containing monoamine oxidase A isoform X1 [Tachysurus ichikawai]
MWCRVGGRTLTLSLPTSNGHDSWDMGGQWVGSSQTHIMDLIQELGLEVYPQFTEGMKVHHPGGVNAKISTYTSSIPPFSPLVLLDFINFLWRV